MNNSIVFSAAFSPTSKYLASGSQENTIKLWSIGSQNKLATLQEHSTYFYSFSYLPDGKYLASSSVKSIRYGASILRTGLLSCKDIVIHLQPHLTANIWLLAVLTTLLSCAQH